MPRMKPGRLFLYGDWEHHQRADPHGHQGVDLAGKECAENWRIRWSEYVMNMVKWAIGIIFLLGLGFGFV